MNKKFLNEVNTIKKMMGLISEQGEERQKTNSTSTTKTLSSLTDDQIAKLKDANGISGFSAKNRSYDNKKIDAIFLTFYSNVMDTAFKSLKPEDDISRLYNFDENYIKSAIPGNTTSNALNDIMGFDYNYAKFLNEFDPYQIASTFNRFTKNKLKNLGVLSA